MKQKCIYIAGLPDEAVPIPGYPKAFAAPSGQIFTQHGRTKLRRFGKNSCGYPICGLRHDDGKHHFVMVHRIIAKLFVSGDQSLTVNHKDMDKTNSAAANLEWITHSENHLKGRVMKPEWSKRVIASLGIEVIATNPLTGEQHEFASGRLAALWVGNSSAGGNISKAIKHGRVAYGFEWSKGKVRK